MIVLEVFEIFHFVGSFRAEAATVLKHSEFFQHWFCWDEDDEDSKQPFVGLKWPGVVMLKQWHSAMECWQRDQISRLRVRGVGSVGGGSWMRKTLSWMKL